jgi:cytochrome c oxidase cbb3-type subunit 1
VTAAIAHRQLTAESAGEIESVRIFSAFTITATFWLLLTTAVGLLLSFKFTYPDLGAYQMLSFGRLRAIHTNGTFYGWASVALTGLAFYVAARSSGVQLQQRRLAWAALWCYNIAAVAGTITLDLGISNGSQEYREWVWPVAFIFLLAVVLSGIVVVATVMARAGHDIYISNWYTIGAFIFTTILGITAAIPVYQFGLGQVAVQGFYMHNAVGMWFTFLALGMTYYALPKLLNRPIYSYALGVLGFWTNLVFYPIIGAHHYEFSPLPWWFQTLAIVFSVGMLVPVWAGSGNFFLTMKGRWAIIRRSYALPFFFVGILYYFVGSTQGHARSVPQPASDLAPYQFHRRPLPLDDVRLHHVRHVGRDLRAAADGDRQTARTCCSSVCTFGWRSWA